MSELKLCDEKHKRIDEKIEVHERRLNNHSERIDKLEQRGASVDARIEHLCEEIKGLVSTLKWGFGIITTIALFLLGILLKG